jgi:hypothetical protein
LAYDGVGALLDKGFDVVLGDVGEGHVEDVVGRGVERGEVSVEEDGVEDACWFSTVSGWFFPGAMLLSVEGGKEMP